MQQQGTKTAHREQITRLLAPVAGTVQQLTVRTTGGVVTPAQALLVVVPHNAQVTAEVSIDNKDIGFVRVGQKAAVKLEAFNFTRYGTAAAVALKRVAGTLPIVITAAVDPVGSKLVDSLARPGSNVTGLSAIGGDLSAKHLELLKTLLPTLASVGVLTHPDNPAHLGVIENVRAAARQLGIVVVPGSARAPNEIDAAFAAMVSARAGAAIIATDAFFSGQGQRLAGLSIVRATSRFEEAGNSGQSFLEP